MILLLPLVHPPYNRHGHQPVLLIHLLHFEQRPVRMPDQTRRGHLGPTKLERGRRGDLQDVRLEAVIDVEDDHVVEFDTVRRWDGGRNRGGRVRPMMGELVELVELVPFCWVSLSLSLLVVLHGFLLLLHSCTSLQPRQRPR